MIALCVDATRFGCGLKEAVELTGRARIAALEYSFDQFAVAARTLSFDETQYLADVKHLALSEQVKIACLNLRYCIDPQVKNAARRFQQMARKLVLVAECTGAAQLGFWLSGSAHDSWAEMAAKALEPVVRACMDSGITPIWHLSTPFCHRGQSLRKWRALGPEDWRQLLARLPDLKLSFSPGDCIWQGIDYLQVLPAFAPLVAHLEVVDVDVNRDLLCDSGLFGPLWWRYRLAGKGQVDWRQLIEALKLYDFSGYLSMQLEDEFVESNSADLEAALGRVLEIMGPLVKG